MARTSPARGTGRAALWGALFLLGTGSAVALRLTGAVNGTTGLILFAISMLPLVLFTRARAARQKATGCSSPAATRYTRRMLAASFAYILGLGLAASLHHRLELEGALAFLVALMPVLPIFGMIWAMGRYLLEEQDEYLRHRAMLASLIGLGAVLSVGSFWGFLESFELVPHMAGWWVVPLWALGMGAGRGWLALRDQRGGEE